MKKLFTLLTIMLLAVSVNAQVKISLVDKVDPGEEEFIDMACTAAKTSIERGGKACGAVIILNGAWRSTGLPTDDATAEENAIAKSRRKNLSNAQIYTINRPTTAAMNAIIAAGVEKVYFVNDKDAVIAAGLATEEDYDVTELSEGNVEVIQLPYAPATKIISK